VPGCFLILYRFSRTDDPGSQYNLFLCAHGLFWVLAQAGVSKAKSVPMACGNWPDVCPSPKELPVAQVGASQARDPVGGTANVHTALKALGFSGRINTAWISRVNLTIRRGVAALARRTWATALHTPHLQAHLNWWQASYHFVYPHASLRMSLGQPLEHESKLRAQWYR
jgi:hypothetical protein